MGIELEYFGLEEDANLQQLQVAYEEKNAVLQEKVFLPGTEGEDAAFAATELKQKYKEADDYIKNRDFYEGNPMITDMIMKASQTKNGDDIQKYLDVILDKDAYWHYIQSVVFYIKNLNFEALRHLKWAVQLAPNNHKYSQALLRLGGKILVEET